MIIGTMPAKVKKMPAKLLDLICARQSLVVFAMLVFALAAPAYVQAGCIAHTAGELYLNMPSSGVPFRRLHALFGFELLNRNRDGYSLHVFGRHCGSVQRIQRLVAL